MRYVLLAFLALAACKSEEPLVFTPGPSDQVPASVTVAVTTNETSFGPDFSKMDWTLNLVDGKPVAYSATINLGVEGRVSGQAPCNRYSGSLKADGNSFVPGMIASTKMACENMAVEADFFKILAGVTTKEGGSGIMTLRGGGHELTFVQPIN
jgi:heat shock protein HslJ